MRYCERCGAPHECAADEAAAALDRDVEIERLRTRRDIEVAKITASADKAIAETEAEHAADFAEGKAEGMETVLDAGAPEVAPDGAPIVVDAPEPEPEPEPEPDLAPPAVDDRPVIQRSRSGGWWDGYK